MEKQAENTTEAETGLIRGADGRLRCFWATATDTLYQHYHDTEWGRPTRDSRYIFEKICLEGFQAGLSWLTILRKRENFRAAFADFDFHRLAACPDIAARIEELRGNSGIIRHRGKIAAVFANAKAAVKLEAEFGSLAAYLDQFLPAGAARLTPKNLAYYRHNTRTAESAALAKDLRRRGFQFFGPTTAYAFIQAIGMVNDHLAGCCCAAAAEAAQRQFYCRAS